MTDRLPGQAPFSAIVEGAEPWGDLRTHRKFDARWKGIAGRLLDSASPRGVGYAMLGALPTDGDGFTLGGVVFEFDDDATIVAGATSVTIAPGDEDATADNLVAALNASAAGVDAVKLTVGTGVEVAVAVISRGLRGDQSNLAFSATTWTDGGSFCQDMQDGATPAAYREAKGTYLVTAADATAATSPSEVSAGFPIGATNFAEQPEWLSVQLFRAGVLIPPTGVAFTWAQANGDHWVLMCDDVAGAGSVLVAGDVIHWSTCSF